MLTQDYFKVGKKFYYFSPDVNETFSGMEVDVNKTADLRVEVLKEAINEKTLVNKYQPEITLQEAVSFIESCNKPGLYIFLVRNNEEELVWLYAVRYADGKWHGSVYQLDRGRGWLAGARLVLRNKPLDTSDPQSLCPHCGEIIRLSK